MQPKNLIAIRLNIIHVKKKIVKIINYKLRDGLWTRSNLGGGFVPLFPLFTSGPSD